MAGAGSQKVSFVSGPDVVRTALRIANEHVSKAAAATDAKPTMAEKEAGNYVKGRFTWNGLLITVENDKGSIRKGGAPGKEWSVVMPAVYGYVRRTVGADGDHLDIYMGPNPLSPLVWVIDQVHHKTKKFDEHKVMLGFDTKEQATETYHKAFSDGKGPDRIGGIKQMTVGKFKAWLRRGDCTQPLCCEA